MKSNDKDAKLLMEKGLEIIKRTFGPNRAGTHNKKCDICGEVYQEPNDIFLLPETPSCPKCVEIVKLRKNLYEHWSEYSRREDDDPIYQSNFYEDNSLDIYMLGSRNYTLDEYEEKYEIVGRTKRVNEYIDRVKKARMFLYCDLGGQFEIIKSIWEKKDLFWKEGGNLAINVKISSVAYFTSQIREYFDDECPYSIYKLKNIIINDKKYLFDKHKITSIKTFKKSEDIVRTEFPPFPINKYLDDLNDVLDSYKKYINAIVDYRNNKFAHEGDLKNPDESKKEFNFYNISRIYNSLKIIYDGFYYSIAPDLYSHLRVDHGIFFDHLNQLIAEKKIK